MKAPILGFCAELRIVTLGSSISLTVRQRGKAIYSVFFLGGSSSVLAVLATILLSALVVEIAEYKIHGQINRLVFCVGGKFPVVFIKPEIDFHMCHMLTS